MLVDRVDPVDIPTVLQQPRGGAQVVVAPAEDGALDVTLGALAEPLTASTGASDGPPRGDADALVEEHLGLADRIARRLTPAGQAREDFVQVARLGLVEAARRFEPGRGVPFSAYASTVITGHLKHHLRDRCWSVRPPRRLQDLWLQATATRDRLSQRLGRAPTVAELAGALEVSEVQLVEALGAQQAWSADSFERLTDAQGPAWEPAVAEAGFELVDDRSWLRPALKDLPERLQLIVELRFVHELTQSQIAERVGVSQMHVSRLLAQALAQLRDAAELEPVIRPTRGRIPRQPRDSAADDVDTAADDVDTAVAGDAATEPSA